MSELGTHGALAILGVEREPATTPWGMGTATKERVRFEVLEALVEYEQGTTPELAVMLGHSAGRVAAALRVLEAAGHVQRVAARPSEVEYGYAPIFLEGYGPRPAGTVWGLTEAAWRKGTA